MHIKAGEAAFKPPTNPSAAEVWNGPDRTLAYALAMRRQALRLRTTGHSGRGTSTCGDATDPDVELGHGAFVKLMGLVQR